MPINQSKMKAMKKQYGEKKGEDVYYATEQKAKKTKAYQGKAKKQKPMKKVK